jgi:hypothetical protein
MVVGGMTGDVKQSLNFPWLSIAHGVGGLAGIFNPGDIVLDKEHKLAEKKGRPLDIIILNTNTYWKEHINYASGGGAYKPRVFANEGEVRAAGLSTEYTEDRMAPRAARAMTLRILIKKPADVSCAYFAVELGGSLWAPARWAVDKTAYTKVSAKLDPVVGFALRNKSLLHGSWQLSTDTEKRGTNTVVVPVLKYVGATQQAVVDDVLNLFNAPKA